MGIFQFGLLTLIVVRVIAIMVTLDLAARLKDIRYRWVSLGWGIYVLSAMAGFLSPYGPVWEFLYPFLAAAALLVAVMATLGLFYEMKPILMLACVGGILAVGGTIRLLASMQSAAIFFMAVQFLTLVCAAVILFRSYQGFRQIAGGSLKWLIVVFLLGASQVLVTFWHVNPVQNPVSMIGTIAISVAMLIFFVYLEQTLLQARFQHGEERYRRIVQNAQEGIWETDSEGRTVFSNEALQKLLGYSAEELRNRPVEEFVYAYDQDSVQEIRAKLRQGERIQYEVRLLRRDGDLITALVSSSPIQNTEKVYQGAVDTVLDMSEQYQRQQELTVIANVSSALRLAPTRKEMGPILVDQAAQLLHAAAAALVIRVGDYDEVFVEEAGGAWASLRGLRCKSVELTERLAEVTPDYYVACGIVAAREQQIGAVWVGRERVFEVGEQHLLYSISDITANAIQRAALHETTENRARQLAIANRMGQELVGSRELHSVYQTACKYVRQLINADNFGISLYDTEKSELTAAFMMNGADEIDPSEFPPLHYTPADANYGRAKAIYTARPVVCDELGSRARAGRGHFLGQGELPETGVYVPLLVEGRVIGLMELQSYQVNIYNQNEADFLSMLANQVGLAIMNARLFDETQRQLRQLTSLRAIDQTIIHNMDLSSTLKAICEQAAVQLNVEGVAVHLARGKSGVLALMACCSPDGKLMFRGKVGHTLAAWVAEKRTILTIDDMANPPEEFLGDESIQAVHEAGIQKYVGIPLESKNMFEGVMELYGSDARRMDREWLEFSITIAGQLSIAVENAILFSDLQQSNRELAEAYDATIEGWSRALDLRDKETEGHTRRVTDMTLRLAEAMGVSGEERVYYRRGALLHDIGKMGIPDSILLKPGSLTTEEWAIMRRHPSYAQAMLSPIPYLWQSLDIPYSHHERWDGSGYPRGLKGELIPLAARIFAVVDVWDALTSNRPYRPAWGEEEALAYIRDQAGKHFDPAVVNIFLENYPEWTKT